MRRRTGNPDVSVRSNNPLEPTWNPIVFMFEIDVNVNLSEHPSIWREKESVKLATRVPLDVEIDTLYSTEGYHRSRTFAKPSTLFRVDLFV